MIRGMKRETYFDWEEFRRAFNAKGQRRGLRELSDEIGTSIATLSRFLRGKPVDLDTVLKICDWLDNTPMSVFVYARGSSCLHEH